MTTRKTYLRIGLLAAAVLLFLLPSFATVYTDWLWFLEVGHEQVFLRTLNTRIAARRSHLRGGVRACCS